MEIFTKIIEFFKKVWKYIAFAFTLIFITKIGGLLTKMRSSNKKEIKKEAKQVEVKLEEVKEQEQELVQSLEKKDEKVEQIIKNNTDRKEDLKTFLPDL